MMKEIKKQPSNIDADVVVDDPDSDVEVDDLDSDVVDDDLDADVDATDVVDADVDADDVVAADVDAVDVVDADVVDVENMTISDALSINSSIEIEEDITGEANKKLVNDDNVQKFHPESHTHNYDEIHKASYVTRNKDNIIVDPLHKTIPIMTKYEKTKILGQRTKQLDNGALPFVKLDKEIMDNSLIAEEELYQKKMPFIIQRPMPGGGFEYWHVKDLEIVRDD